MHSPACQGIQVNSERCHQGFAFTGLHLGDHSAMHHQAANQLYVIMPQSKRPLRCFANLGKRFGNQIIKFFTLLVPFPQFECFRFQLIIRKSLNGRLQLIGLLDDLTHFFDQPVVSAANNFSNQLVQHWNLLLQTCPGKCGVGSGLLQAKTPEFFGLAAGYLSCPTNFAGSMREPLRSTSKCT